MSVAKRLGGFVLPTAVIFLVAWPLHGSAWVSLRQRAATMGMPASLVIVALGTP